MASADLFEHFRKVIRASSFRPYFLVMGCCAVETDIIQSSVYDLSRLGVIPVESPEQADVLFTGGWVNKNFEKKIRAVYKELQAPKYVIGIGTCAISGTPYISKSEKVVLSEVVPVDVFVSGCPPGVEAYVEALLELRRKIFPNKDQRTVLQSAIRTGSVQV